MGRFAGGGGLDPAILEALRARAAAGGDGFRMGGGPGQAPTPIPDDLPMPTPMPQRLGGRQDLGGATVQNGQAGVIGRGGNFQPLGRAAQGRLPPVSGPPMAGPDGGPPRDWGGTPVLGGPGGGGQPPGPVGLYTGGDLIQDTMPQTPLSIGGGADGPMADPRIMAVLDRIRMQPPPTATTVSAPESVGSTIGGPTTRARVPGVRTRPPAGAGGAAGGAQLGGPAPPMKPGAPPPAPMGGGEATPMAKPPAAMPPMSTQPMVSVGAPSPEGPAFDDMLKKMRQRGGIGGRRLGRVATAG